MALLKDDTEVEGSDGVFKGYLSEDWRIWSPNGGYLMAMILRAASKSSEWPKPLSIMCQFLSVGEFAEVEISVISLRKTRIAESLKISMFQGKKHLVEALVWTGDSVPGYEHDVSESPKVETHNALKNLSELIPNFKAPYPFFKNYECKPANFTPFERKVNLPPYQYSWYRFIPSGNYNDPYVNAGRYLILLDSFGWTAASQAHRDDSRFMAPTLSLSVDFHRFDVCPWLLSESTGEIAEDGLIGVRNKVWSDGGKLLASASGTLICRLRPGA